MPGFHTLTFDTLPHLPLRPGVLYLLDGEVRRLGALFEAASQRPRWRTLSLDTRDKEDELALVLLRLCRRYGIHKLELDDAKHPQAPLLRRLAALDGWGAEEWPRLG